MRCFTRAGVMGLLLAALLIGLRVAMPVAAQDEGTGPGNAIDMRVLPALEGAVKYGEWLPLYVQLTNGGGDVEAEVRAAVNGSSGYVSYAAPAPLPAGARKDIVLYVQPPSFAQAITVELVQLSGNDVLAEARVDVTPFPRSAYLIGALTPEPDALGALNRLDLTGRDAARLLPLSLATFPARAEALRSLDCLVVSGLDTSSLTPDQAEALVAWIEEGGRLVIGGGAGARRTLSGLPDTLRPIELAGIVELEALDSLADFAGEAIQLSGPFAAALPAEVRGRVLLAEEGQPLLVQAARGEGWVTYLALDPAGSPFTAWAGSPAFWKRLLEPGAALEANVPTDISTRAMESEQMGYALANLPSLELPSVRWLALLLSFYILLVGPVNYLVLRQVGRLDMAWVSIPTLTLLFSVAGYGLGYRLRGNDVIIHQVSIVSMVTESPDAAVRSYIGLFSPARQNYQLNVGTDALIGPLWQRGRDMYGAAAAPLNVVQGDPATVRGLGVNQWSMESVLAETRLDGMGDKVQADLIIEGDNVRGTLRNRLAQPLEGVVVVLGNRFARLGDVAAAEEVEVTATLEGNTMGAVFPWSLFQYEDTMGGGMVSSQRTLRESVLSAYFHTNWGPPPAPSSPLLFAWTDEQPLEVEVNRVRATRQSATLIVLKMPLKLAQGDVELPFGVLSSRVMTIEGDAGQCGANGQIYLASGSATLEYSLPGSMQGLQIRDLQIRVGTDGRSWVKPPEVALYDWSQGVWVALSSIEWSVAQSLEEPERFLDGASGTIRLLAAQDDRQNAMCYQFDLALEGQMNASYGEVDGD